MSFFVSYASSLPEDLLQIFTGGIFQPCQHGVKAAQAVGRDGNRCHIGVALLHVPAASEGGRHPKRFRLKRKKKLLSVHYYKT